MENMNIRMSNEITIENATDEIFKYCDRELVIDNPEYLNKERLGLYLGYTPRTLRLFKNYGGKLVIPIGAFKGINEIIKDNGLNPTYELDFANNEKVDYKADMHLYDYQETAVQAMVKKGYGILEAPAGSGKTQCGLAISAYTGWKTLWLTHTVDLLKQSKDRAISCGFDTDLIGTITGGKVDVGKGITFSTIQTMSKLDMEDFKYMFDCVIVDECHRVAGTPLQATMFSSVLQNLKCKHKYGMSATVHRADGMLKTTFMYLGDINYTVPKEAVADKIQSVQIKPIHFDTDIVNYDCLDTDGTVIYSKLISCLAEDEERNRKIADTIIKEKGQSMIVLSDRLSQLDSIYEMLPKDMQEQSVIVNGTMTSKKQKLAREQAMDDMRDGRKKILFASYKLAKEGLDIPLLSRLFMASPVKDEAIVIQSIGRIARKHDNKKDAVCYDFCDDEIRTFKYMAIARRRHYKKCDTFY